MTDDKSDLFALLEGRLTAATAVIREMSTALEDADLLTPAMVERASAALDPFEAKRIGKRLFPPKAIDVAGIAAVVEVEYSATAALGIRIGGALDKRPLDLNNRGHRYLYATNLVTREGELTELGKAVYLHTHDREKAIALAKHSSPLEGHSILAVPDEDGIALDLAEAFDLNFDATAADALLQLLNVAVEFGDLTYIEIQERCERFAMIAAQVAGELADADFEMG